LQQLTAAAILVERALGGFELATNPPHPGNQFRFFF
jgi:hypothetical protein